MTMKLMQGDCLEQMKEIPDKSIDMILCDLPYGTTRNSWDFRIDLNKLFTQYHRIIKRNGVIALFSQSPFNAELIVANKKNFRYEWIWEKAQGTGHLNANKMPMKKHENILIFYRKLPTYNPQFMNGKPYTSIYATHSSNYGKQKNNIKTVNKGKRYPTDILKFTGEKGLHPTQKPVSLLAYLIKTYTNEGETVLDNCMGSGSTGVAYLHTNRNFIGIEKDENYFKIAENRIHEAEQEIITSMQ